MNRLAGWQRYPHFTAVFQALFVTFLWSTSWVLIKIGLVDIPALPLLACAMGWPFFACCLSFGAALAGLRHANFPERPGCGSLCWALCFTP